MVSGINMGAAVNAVNAAYAQFDRAAGAVVADAGPDAANTGDIAGAIVEMDASKIAIAAALMVMKKSNEMLADSIDIGGYGVQVER
jgi:hypothetical protein